MVEPQKLADLLVPHSLDRVEVEAKEPLGFENSLYAMLPKEVTTWHTERGSDKLCQVHEVLFCEAWPFHALGKIGSDE